MRLCFGLFQDREGSDWKRRNEPSRSHGRVLLLWGRICVSKNKWSRVVGSSSNAIVGDVIGQNSEDNNKLMTFLSILKKLEGIDVAHFTKAVKALKDDFSWRDMCFDNIKWAKERSSQVMHRDARNTIQKLWANSNDDNFLLGCPIETRNISRHSKLNTEALGKFNKNNF